MSTGRHSFKLNDAARFMRAVKAAGLEAASFVLDPKSGKITVVVKSGGGESNDEVENWVKKQHADKP